MKVQTRPSFSNGLLPRRADWLRLGAAGGELLLLATGYLLLPVWPLIAGALARDWRYVARYPRSMVAAVAHMRAGFRTHAVARHLARSFAPRETVTPVGSCTHCSNCCLQKSCIFVEFDSSGRSSWRCRSPRWRFRSSSVST